MLAENFEISNSKVGLSNVGHISNGSSRNTKNPDYNSVVPIHDEQYFEYASGGSWVRVANQTIDPHITKSASDVNWKRGKITRFSKRSRRNLLSLVSKLDKSAVSPDDVLFITLTTPAVGWMSICGKGWKQRLNNFLTQLRKKYKDIGLCGIWRLEFQERGAPHFHIVSYNVSYIDHDWIAEKWNKICSPNLGEKAIKDHYNAGTQVERARYWGKVNQYFSKTMAYVAKDETWKRQSQDASLVQWMETFGKHWGVICRDNLKELIKVVVGKFDTPAQFYKVRRVIKRYVQSGVRRRLGVNYSHKVSKALSRVYDMKDKCKHMAFIPDDLFKKVLSWSGLSDEVIATSV